jgi:hypothetical protein
MNRIKPIDMFLIDALFEREHEAGYVLNFSDKTFAEFFARELNIDIDDPTYARNGRGKLKRLRCLLQTVDNPTAVCTLRALGAYRESMRQHFQQEEKVPDAHARLLDLIRRLEGGLPTPPPMPPKLAADAVRIAQLRQDLVQLPQMAPQPRGYAFEKFLKDLFDAYGMEGREPFRLRGEQIDGSFQLGSETYLLEAKWENAPTGVGDLHGFHGKVEQKAAWARGLFISHSGFTDEGLHAFGRGKRVICMDGYDLYETLNRGLSLTDVLSLKVRRAAETGCPFLRVRDLFPM